MSLLGRKAQSVKHEPTVTEFPHEESFYDSVEFAPRPHRRGTPKSAPGLWAACSNPACRSGWMHVWRSHTTPIFEGGWTCSPECTEKCIRTAIARETDARGAVGEGHRHRIPLGLLMLRHGWITPIHLREALEAQRLAGSGRLGHWLICQHAASEAIVSKALALQWNCPVLSDTERDPQRLVPFIPRLFVDAYGALPWRLAAGQVLYLGFEEGLDPALALAMERMSDLRVDCGIVPSSLYFTMCAAMLKAEYPSIQLVEAVSQSAAAHALTRSLEKARPVASRLVRVHDCLWLRIWKRLQAGAVPELADVEDILCSLPSIGS